MREKTKAELLIQLAQICLRNGGKCKAKLWKFKHFQMARQIQRFTGKLVWELATWLFLKRPALRRKCERAFLTASFFQAAEHYLFMSYWAGHKKRRKKKEEGKLRGTLESFWYRQEEQVITWRKLMQPAVTRHGSKKIASWAWVSADILPRRGTWCILEWIKLLVLRYWTNRRKKQRKQVSCII